MKGKFDKKDELIEWRTVGSCLGVAARASSGGPRRDFVGVAAYAR